MAGTISSILSVEVSNDGFTDTFSSGTESVTQVAEGAVVYVGTLTTSDTEMTQLDELTTLGIAIIRNLDDTNYITVGTDSGGSIVPAFRVGPGETSKVKLVPSTTYRWQANTASCDVELRAYNA